MSYLDSKKVGDIVHLQVFRDNKIEDVSVTLGPGQNLQQGPSSINPSLPPDSNIPQPLPVQTSIALTMAFIIETRRKSHDSIFTPKAAIRIF